MSEFLKVFPVLGAVLFVAAVQWATPDVDEPRALATFAAFASALLLIERAVQSLRSRRPA